MTDTITTIEEHGAPAPPARPRERIVVQARDLFRKHGIRGIGVDAIADAAGTNKMTLYRHFGSKDELVVECLRKVAEDIEAMWHALEAAHPDDPWAALDAWVRHGAERMICDRRGCDLANAAVELAEADHPARHVIADLKTAYRDRLADLCRRAGARDADLLADTLTLLLEGARVSRQSVGPEGPSARFVRMGQAIIATFRTPAPSP
ncbi:MAG TPA: TetR/AcrR family transcriptional regulator [Lichenihabitans sp.]|jgi:AcrR family transcriptional regulator|nr:TetR/AcrR family transcriptional regulator [Lichenihabitans sp.]